MKWKRNNADILPLAEAMQELAREVIRKSGIREAWEGIGAKVNQVGSMATGLLMKHRDIDFHIYTDTLDAAESFKAISQICASPNVTRMEYRNLATTDEACQGDKPVNIILYPSSAGKWKHSTKLFKNKGMKYDEEELRSQKLDVLPQCPC